MYGHTRERYFGEPRYRIAIMRHRACRERTGNSNFCFVFAARECMATTSRRGESSVENHKSCSDLHAVGFRFVELVAFSFGWKSERDGMRCRLCTLCATTVVVQLPVLVAAIIREK